MGIPFVKIEKIGMYSQEGVKSLSEAYWGFEDGKVTFDSERYKTDFKQDVNEVLGLND